MHSEGVEKHGRMIETVSRVLAEGKGSYTGKYPGRVRESLLTEHLYRDLSGLRLSVSVARRAPVLDHLVGVTRPGYTAQSEDCCVGQQSSRVTHFGPLDRGWWGPSHVTGEIQILAFPDISI